MCNATYLKLKSTLANADMLNIFDSTILRKTLQINIFDPVDVEIERRERKATAAATSREETRRRTSIKRKVIVGFALNQRLLTFASFNLF